MLALVGHRYASTFRDEETVWSYTLRGNPDSWTAHDNLGIALHDSGRTAMIAQYQEALQGHPDEAEVHNNFGVTLHDLGRTAEAIAQYREALQIQPGYAGGAQQPAWGLPAR